MSETTQTRSFRLRAPIIIGVMLVSLVVLLPGLACGGSAIPDSGIEGFVTIGPISPVVTPGSVDNEPYSALLRIKNLPGEDLVATVQSDEEGLFRVALEPGRYLVEPENGNPLPIAESQEVTVSPGRYTHIDVAYDSGIR